MKNKTSLYSRFKKLYGKHGLPFICRELDIDVDTYNKLARKLNSSQ